MRTVPGETGNGTLQNFILFNLQLNPEYFMDLLLKLIHKL
jgi:hypothetical protein